MTIITISGQLYQQRFVDFSQEFAKRDHKKRSLASQNPRFLIHNKIIQQKSVCPSVAGEVLMQSSIKKHKRLIKKRDTHKKLDEILFLN